MKTTHLVCLFLGWVFVLIGVAGVVVNNRAAEVALAGTGAWWAFIVPFPIGALFLIASGIAKAGGTRE